MRILAIDPGQKRIGIAVSDPSGTIANPLTVIHHISRPVDAATIAAFATDYEVNKIVVGQSLDEDNQPTLEGRRAARLAAAIRQQTDIPVQLWDESNSTGAARFASIQMGESYKKRRQRSQGHLDDLAATVILQSYLDGQGEICNG